ncbi:MAG: PqqD family protein [Eubacterium sp.]|nr:PqqD family protein [Eubacterium sp.]MDD7210121.1 PqqD family protein [Lachnospiraceae bacterium]MDY5496505.1 PqqD family protein [Anaerobutyricum sp.]
MALKKIEENYLDFIPAKNPEVKYKIDENDKVTIFMKWEGFFHRIAQKFFHRPKVSDIDLDEYGSFVWLAIDDQKTVYDLSKEMEATFPDMEKPLPRLIKFLEILKDHHLISFSRKENKNSRKEESQCHNS